MNAMTTAIAKAAKADSAKQASLQQNNVVEAVEKHNVNSVTAKSNRAGKGNSIPPVVLQSKAVPMLYRVEEIAEEIGCSLSYVYLMISKMKPQPMAKDGKSHLFSSDFVEELKSVPRRKRMAKVKVISQKHLVANVKPAETEVKTEQKETKQISLLERIDTLETTVAELRQLLGI